MIKNRWYLIALIIAACTFTACDDTEPEGPVHHSGLTCADWGYEENNGPDKWIEIGCDKCGGEKQSPIDIVTAAVTLEDLPDLAINYSPVPLAIYNNGHTVQIQYNGEEPSTIMVDGEAYVLVQIHFHAASEHTIDGQHAPMEMHLVHAHPSRENDLAVIGVMIEEGTAHPDFDPLWENIPDKVSEEPAMIAGVTVNAMNLLPQKHGYYRYEGSLTTPNAEHPENSCAEIVKWYVIKQPITLSAEQIARFTALHHDNFRPTQALNARTVTGTKM